MPAGMLFMVFVVHVTKSTVIGAMLSAALETILVGPSVSFRQLLVQLPVLAIIVVVIVRERGDDRYCQPQHRGCYEAPVQGH